MPGGASQLTILIEPDPFAGLAEDVASYVPKYKQANTAQQSRRPSAANTAAITQDALRFISRPFLGQELKPETHAFAQVLKADGSLVNVFNAMGNTSVHLDGAGQLRSDTTLEGTLQNIVNTASGRYQRNPSTPYGVYKDAYSSTGDNQKPVWTDWILQSVEESRVEKTQIIETFGRNYLYAFGEKPRAVNISGMLFNSANYNWTAVFWENWKRYFRASRLIEMGARMYIHYEDVIIGGYPVNATSPVTATNPQSAPFSMTMYITDYINLAAQSGFVGGLSGQVAYARAGYAPGSTELKTNRISLLDRYGLSARGAAAIAGDNGLVRYALNELKAGVAAGLYGEASVLAFLRATTLRTTYLGIRTGIDAAVRAAEDSGFGTGNPLVRGEINAWFGLLGQIMRGAMRGADVAQNGGWSGVSDFGSISVTGLLGEVGNYVALGSIDRIVQSLAYNTASATLGLAADLSGAEGLALESEPLPYGIATMNIPSGPAEGFSFSEALLNSPTGGLPEGTTAVPPRFEIPASPNGTVPYTLPE